MANTKSAKKAAKQNEKRRLINNSRMSACKTYLKKLKHSMSGAVELDKEKSLELLKICQSKLGMAVRTGILKLNTASRKISKIHHVFKQKFNETKSA
ncbi:MAG: 30S ribosomal protein S20 [Rickettsiales bacterium]